MTTIVGNLRRSSFPVPEPLRVLAAVCVATVLGSFSGCAAMRPLKGVDAGELPDEFRMPQRSAKAMIDLSLLRRTPPREHIIDADDILTIYVEGYLGGVKAAPPVSMRQSVNSRSSLGYPIRVREDGTISLPAVKPIHVRGMTILQAEQAVRNAYTRGEKKPLVAGAERVFVDLHRPRHYRVLVMRQESGGRNSVAGAVGRTDIAQNRDKRGTGRTVSLPAYQNDVLHALAETGGLPGLDAENVIYVIRNHGQPLPIEKSSKPKPANQPGPVFAPAPVRAVPQVEQTIRKVEEPDLKTTEPTSVWELSRRGSTRANRIRLVSGRSPHTQPEPSFGGHSPLPSYEKPAQHSETASSSSSTPSPANTNATADYGSRSTGWPHRAPVPVQSYPVYQSPVAVPGYPAPASYHWPARHDLAMLGANVIRIPLRLIPGEVPAITEEDITLYDGDVVLIESRDSDVFFTGGLLGGGRFTLPRDQDLDVLQALAIVQSQPIRSYPTRSLGGVSATNQDVTVGASNLVILRRRADGSQISIRVDLYKAMRDPQERVLVQPGDHLILQYTRLEAVAAFFERHILDGVILGGSSGLFFSN